MITPEMWVWVLAVVLTKAQTRRWIHRTMFFDKRRDDVHSELFDPYTRRFPKRNPDPYKSTTTSTSDPLCADRRCTCPRCVAEFDQFFQWVQIR